MSKFSTDKIEFESELLNVVRMFNLNVDKIDIFTKGNKIECVIGSKKYRFRFELADEPNERAVLTEYKIALYKALSKFVKVKLPWGSLTGIRPTRIVYKFINSGKTLTQATSILKKKYLVSAPRVELVKTIIKQQEGLLFDCDNYINIYIHIPFCPSRCSYCSFVSVDVNKFKELVDPYLDRLEQELEAIKPLINKKILSIYIGGGTPTSISVEQLYRLLKMVEGLDAKNIEYTVEAGRPDTFDIEKLLILKRFGVNRICINPQALSQSLLQQLSRNHTVEQVFEAFQLSRKFDFNINMDLIAGFDNQTLSEFYRSIDACVQLNPDNITVHTLSIKNGSKLSEGGARYGDSAIEMCDYALKTLTKMGYLPYYLYRQKNTASNLENIGYALKDKQSIFNITSMEESVSILGFGAGSITKIVDNVSIERFANLRDVGLYVNDFDTMMAKKLKFLLQEK